MNAAFSPRARGLGCLALVSIFSWSGFQGTLHGGDLTDDGQFVDSSNKSRQGLTDEMLAFEACAGKDEPSYVAGLLDAIASSPNSSLAAELVASRLSFNSKLYSERDKFEAVRLRGYVIAAMSRMRVHDAAIPHLIEALRNSQDPLSRAAAARAAGTLGVRGRSVVPILIESTRAGHVEVPVVIDQFDQFYAPDDLWTTERIEAIKAVGRLGCKDAIPVCEAIIKYETPSESAIEHEIVLAARESLMQLSLMPLSPASVADTRDNCWTPELGTRMVVTDSLDFSDENGATVTSEELLGTPCVLAFFYTGCNNAQRCASTVDNLIRFGNILRQERISDRIKLCLVTLEPERDRPEMLKKHGEQFGFLFNKNNTILRPRKQSLEYLVETLQMPVSTCCGTVTNHGVTWYLTDANGRLVGRYRFQDDDQHFTSLLQAARLVLDRNTVQKVKR